MRKSRVCRIAEKAACLQNQSGNHASVEMARKLRARALKTHGPVLKDTGKLPDQFVHMDHFFVEKEKPPSFYVKNMAEAPGKIPVYTSDLRSPEGFFPAQAIGVFHILSVQQDAAEPVADEEEQREA